MEKWVEQEGDEEGDGHLKVSKQGEEEQFPKKFWFGQNAEKKRKREEMRGKFCS